MQSLAPVNSGKDVVTLDCISSLKPFTLATTAWAALSSITQGYSYYAEIADADVTASSYVRVDFAFSCIEVCQYAEIASAGVTSDGKIIVYAKTPPTMEVTGVYSITKEVAI